MKTTGVFYVRHAEPDYTNHDDLTRALTAKGEADCRLVTRFLRDKGIQAVLSSPYLRAVDTVAGFAREQGLEMEIIPDFRERKIGNVWLDDFDAFAARQWADFDCKLPDGESLKEVQERNIRALHAALLRHPGQNIVIAGHGTALSTILNYYDPAFGFRQFMEIKGRMPWIVQFSFEGTRCLRMRECDLGASSVDPSGVGRSP